ncbi:2-dehydropantoate 2-reductase [Lederbergia wuyishanensis]|uniref:2-dehydropantoate 2-reductase n=1 Tax=Lederbergia wuyishanensis TaxID=1347903 RepID=A0ABU0CZF6_9BACI|nr:2-dehydropantoate 2-reductase [Lederbergia wuyishanensis]MCJ8006167.1 2-dehydropantoate 2-reductase [Lederbergia wuyishanensis]MDQ0341537.1 2-dehydropantoate 2-reductase [Lederbergia wuyishanensis]
MKIGIIGGGAVGLLFGAYLSYYHDVSIFTKTNKQAQLLTKHGVTILRENTKNTCTVIGFNEYENIECQDFIIVAVKQYDLDSLIEVFNNIPITTPILFIQNGMGHLQLLDALPHSFILVGTVEHGVIRIDYETINHTGIGKTNIAVYRGKSEFEKFPSINDSFFPIQFQTNFKNMLHSKLIANALINPLTAIYQVPNGKLIENPYYYETFLMLFNEILPLFPEMDEKATLKEVASICKKTKYNTSSMLKDIKEGRRTEIDAILGYIIEQGNKNGQALPFTEIIFNMVRGKELEGGFNK